MELNALSDQYAHSGLSQFQYLLMILFILGDQNYSVKHNMS